MRILLAVASMFLLQQGGCDQTEPAKPSIPAKTGGLSGSFQFLQVNKWYSAFRGREALPWTPRLANCARPIHLR